MTRTALAWLFTTIVLTPRAAGAQPTDADVGPLAGFLELFPQSRTAPAPSTLVPSVRVTYDLASAIIGSPGPSSGAGVLQYDIVSRDGRQILAFARSYANDGRGFYPVSQEAARGYPGVGPFWISPSVLTNAESLQGSELRVTRAPKTLADGTQTTVVRFQSTNSSGTLVYEFDANTGIMVFSSISTGPSMSQVVFREMRSLSLPWGRARAPNWVRPGATIDFEGIRSTTIPFAGTVTEPFEVQFSIVEAGARWSLARARARLAGRPQPEGMGATGELQMSGALWVSPSVLSAPLTPEAIRIDRDPITEAETFAAREMDGAIRVEVVTSVSKTTNWFNPTLGVLDRLRQEIDFGTSLIVLELARTGGDTQLEALAQEPALPEDPAETGPTGGDSMNNPSSDLNRTPEDDDDKGGCTASGGGSSVGTLGLLGVLLGFMRRSKPRERRAKASLT